MNFSIKYRILALGIALFVLSFTPVLSQIKIMPLGDSISKGTGSSDNAGYREDLKSMLEDPDVGISCDFVGSLADGSFGDNQHEGHEGYTTGDINAAINSWLATANPDYVLVLVGANDITEILSGTATVGSVMNNIEAIVNKIYNHNSNTQILLSSLTPRSNRPADSLAVIINRNIKILYEEKKTDGYEVLYVGNYELLKTNENWATEYMLDHIHPNDTGYNEMAKAFYHAIHNVYNHVAWGSPNVRDNFDRKILSDVWYNEAGEFEIYRSGSIKELSNSVSDDSWSHLAIFKSASNPSAITFNWGSTTDADGIIGTGVAVMLHRVNVQTRGYIVRFKKEGNHDYLNLWTIKDGTPRDMIDETPNLVAAPAAGDQCQVVMYSDGSAHHFDCYIRGEFAGTLEDPGKIYGRLSDDLTELYSGFMLKGGYNNHIDNFDLYMMGDTTRPAAVQNLDVISSTSSSVTLSWTAPGDDGTTGKASHYEIRYATQLITQANWHLAIPARGVGVPSNPGAMDNFVFAGLQPATTYYFAIKTADEVYNWAKLSNIKQATTSSGGGALQKAEEFNDQTSFQNNWSYHSAYTIANGQLTNFNGTGWESLAVFKMNVNPEQATLQWAAAPASDEAGIDKGGITMLLDSPNYSSANGYLCTIRTQAGSDPVLYLFPIQTGQAQAPIATFKSVGQAKPQPEGLMKIVVSSDDSGHHFDYYLNEIFYGRLSDPSKQFSDGTDYYAGIMLHGGLNNNVERFTIVSKPGKPTYMEKVSPLVNPSGVVGLPLPDSLTIRVLDNNYNPVSNLVVDFSVTQGGGKVDITPKDENIRVEAENANIEGQMQVDVDPNAAAGKFVFTNGGDRFQGKIQFNIYVKTAGNYLIFARTMVNDKNNNSFFVQIDDQPNIQADTVSYIPGSWFLDKTIGQWIWDTVSEGTGSGYKEFYLSQGIHKVTITQRYHPGIVKIDKFIFSRNYSFWPDGKEEVPQYLTDVNGLARAELTLGTTAGTNMVRTMVPGYNLTPSNIDFSITGTADVPVSLVAISSTSQTGKGGEQLPNPFEVQLKDKYNNFAAGYTVNFSVTEGSGTLSNGQISHDVVTDELGKAATFLTLGTEAATNKVRATYSNLTPVTFTATATTGLAHQIKKITTEELSATVNSTLSTPLKVQVVDNVGGAVRHHKVHFAVVEGGGSLSPATAGESFSDAVNKQIGTGDGKSSLATEMDVYTDNQGFASVRLQLGSTAGLNRVTATAQKTGQPLTGSPIEFTAIGTSDIPALLSKVPGFPTNGAAGMPLSAPFEVLVSDQYGNGIVGHSVEFAVKQGGGSLSPNGPWLTEAGGKASVILTLGNDPDVVNIVQASGQHNGSPLGGSPVEFQVTPGTVTTIESASNLNHQGSSGLPIADSLRVRILDNYGNPVGGYPVQWACIGNNKGTVNGKIQADVNSDSYGLSKVQFVGGPIPGMVSQVQASASGLSGTPINFTINIANVDGIQVVDGNNQIGTVGTPLTKPLTVKIVDDLGKSIPGYKINYEVKAGGGHFNNQQNIEVYTNTNNVAEAILTLGSKPGSKNNVVEVVAKRKGVEILENGSLDDWNGATPQSWGLSIGDPQKNSIIRDTLNARSGSCIRIKTSNSTYANIYNNETIEVKPNATYEFSFWAKGAYGGEKLLAFLNDVDEYSLLPDGTWGSSGIPWVDTNALTTVYKKFTVLFTTRSNITGFVRSNIRIYGKDNNIIFIDDISFIEKGADGDMHVNGSPLTFTASAVKGAADSLVYVSGDSQYVVVGNQLENPLVVKVSDKCGNPIINHNVVFEVKAGGGYFDGTKQKTVVTKATNDSGMVQVTYTIGELSGDYIYIVEARAEKTAGGQLRNSPYRFYQSARTSPADKLVRVSGDNQPNAIVRKKLSEPFIVRVEDKFGNGVADHPVTFNVVVGNGTFDDVNGDTTIQKTTGTDGITSVYYFPGPQADLMNVILVTSKNGIHDLNGTPVDFKVTPVRGNASGTGSRISATGPIPADNQTPCFVTITLTDDYGNPIQGKAIILSVTGSSNFISQPTSLTNQSGQTTGSFTSTKAELKTVSAYDVSDGVNLMNVSKVRFTNLEASNLGRYSGSEQVGNFGTALKDPIRARVTDRHGNAVYNHPVYFEVTEGDGQIYTLNKRLLRQGEYVVTDSSGIASAYWVLGPTAQVHWAKAFSPGLAGEAKYLATAKEGTPSMLVKTLGDNQTGIAGYTLADPLVVKVVDENGDPIRDYQVRIKVTYGGGFVNNRQMLTLPTDPFGDATVNFTLGRDAGINQVEAFASGLPNTPVQYFTANAISGAAAKMLKVSGDGNTGPVGGVLSGITVRITDLFDNVYRDGFNVQFGVASGNATIIGNPVVMTGTDGTASVSLQLGTQVGEITVSAYAPGLINNPIKFTCLAIASTPVRMSVHSGNNQNGTVGRELVYPLEVLVEDTYNNPASNVAISFVPSGGGVGTLLTPQLVYTDKNGVAAARFKLGAMTGPYRVKAINNGLIGNGLEFEVTGVTNNFPLFVNLEKEITREEIQTLTFAVNATDDDNDYALTYEASGLPPGATFDAVNSRRFTWTPGYLDAGEYEVDFIVRDSQGGLDAEPVKITINNKNRQPTIISATPMQDYIVGHRDISETINLSIAVTDQDTDDEIVYQWFFNDILVASTQNYSLYVNDAMVDIGFHTIKAVASDGHDEVERSWSLRVKTPVELATFSAEVVPREGVHLQWDTNFEANNAGFNILRSLSKNSVYKKINEELILPEESKSYKFLDSDVKVGETYYYKLEDVSVSGIKTEHDAIQIHVAKPDKFELSQNYPNPFNPTTTINYQLTDPALVKLTIYNLLGQEVKTLVQQPKEAGYHSANWDGIDQNGNQVSSGIYYYRIVAGDFIRSKKMVLIK